MLGKERSTVSASLAATPKPKRMWQSLICRCKAASRVMTLPISTSPPPLGYLVSAWALMSTARLPSPPAPSPNKSNALNARPAPQVLSKAHKTPRSRQRRTISGKSGNSMLTEPGASSHTIRVLAVIWRDRSSGSIGS